MGSKLCCLWCSKPKSVEPDGSSSFIKSKYFKRSENQRRSYVEQYKTHMKKRKAIKPRKLTLEDWLLASPAGLKPDHLKRGECCTFKNSRKKVHPSSSSRQVPRRLISEARDSLCLDRPINNNCKEEEEEEEGEGKPESLSVSGKADKKRVSFKLPHVVILYSPEEKPYNNSSEDSFYSPMEGNCRGGSFESPEELSFRLAVNTLPHVCASSRL